MVKTAKSVDIDLLKVKKTVSKWHRHSTVGQNGVWVERRHGKACWIVYFAEDTQQRDWWGRSITGEKKKTKR